MKQNENFTMLNRFLQVKLDGFADFEANTKHFLRTAIEKWYPECFNDTNQSSSDDQKQTNNFLLNKTQFYVERTNEFSSLIKYVSNERKKLHFIQGTDASARFSGSSDDDGYYRPLMLVKGRSGQGKTVLLSRFVLHIEVIFFQTKTSMNENFIGENERKIYYFSLFPRCHSTSESQRTNGD